MPLILWQISNTNGDRSKAGRLLPFTKAHGTDVLHKVRIMVKLQMKGWKKVCTIWWYIFNNINSLLGILIQKEGKWNVCVNVENNTLERGRAQVDELEHTGVCLNVAVYAERMNGWVSLVGEREWGWDRQTWWGSECCSPQF